MPLGSVTIGLESYDGYQEGSAYFSTDENGTQLEIFISYRGFGLDEVVWFLNDEDFLSFREAAHQAAWWRSRLLEIDVEQTVLRELDELTPTITYHYRSSSFPFETAESTLSFLRQGKDYALTLSENSPGAETRSDGMKILPVFTLHFSGSELPKIRDMISQSGFDAILRDYAEQKATIEAIITSSPE